MMKNIECGAVPVSSYFSVCNTYNKEAGMIVSTAGNITGVYDKFNKYNIIYYFF